MLSHHRPRREPTSTEQQLGRHPKRSIRSNIYGAFEDYDTYAKVHEYFSSRFGTSIEVDGLDTFYDVDAGRQITWFGTNHDAIFSVERYIPLSDVILANGEVMLGGKSWTEFKSAKAFSLWGNSKGWSCSLGFGWGDLPDAGTCYPPGTKRSALEVAVEINGKGRRLDLRCEPTVAENY